MCIPAVNWPWSGLFRDLGSICEYRGKYTFQRATLLLWCKCIGLQINILGYHKIIAS